MMESMVNDKMSHMIAGSPDRDVKDQLGHLKKGGSKV